MKHNTKRTVSGMPKKKERKQFILSIIDRYNGVINWHSSRKIDANTLYSWLGMPVKEKDFKELAKEGVIKSVSMGRGARRKKWVRAGETPEPPATPEPSTPYKLRKQALKEFYEANPHLRRR